MRFREDGAVGEAVSDDVASTTMPASWAQAARLRNHERYGGYDALYNLFFADTGQTFDNVSRAIRSTLERESTYRITGGGRASDGRMLVTVAAGPPEVVIDRVACGTPADAESWCRSVSARGFSVHDGALLWRVAVFEIESTDALAVGLICDHLVCDGRSLWLFERAVNCTHQRSTRLAQPYLSWARSQVTEFGRSMGEHGGLAQDFWRRYLAGGQADAASALDIAVPSAAAFRGVAVTVCAPLQSSLTDVRQAAVAQSVLPLAVVLAKVSAITMRHAVSDDVSLRFITHGRPPGYSRTHGFFADSLPFRADRSLLDGDQQAIHLVARFLEQASPYQDTPWDFIRTRCGGQPVPVDREPGDRQLVVNLVPYDVDQWPMGPLEPVVRHHGHIESLHVVVGLDATGPGRVSATFNPDHFDLPGVQSFVAALCYDLDRPT